VLKTLIIDDEPLAHQVILHLLAQHPDVSVVGQCYNATEALNKLANENVDLLFLDINMPELNGIALLKVLANRPKVIIVSAYQEYAIEGFELDVTDYLLKPVCVERFAQAMDKVRRSTQNMTPEITEPKHIVLKVDREKRKFSLGAISLLEAYGNYVKLWQGNDMWLVSSTLKQLLEQLPEGKFTQVHKSFVVNNAKVVALDIESLSLDCGRKIKVTKSYKKEAQAIL